MEISSMLYFLNGYPSININKKSSLCTVCENRDGWFFFILSLITYRRSNSKIWLVL